MRGRIFILTGTMMLLLSSISLGQFKTGPVFIIKANTPVVIDSLELLPVVDLSMPNTQISNTYIPVSSTPPGSGSIARVVSITPPINFRGETGLFFDNAELNGNTPANLNLLYHTGNGNYTLTNMVTTSNNSNHVVGTTGVNTITIGKLTAVDAGVVLPLQLLSFTGRKAGDVSLLQWNATHEKNMDRFEVEKSTDSRDFSFLVSLKAKGSSSQEQVYNCTDDKPVSGWNYYRLKLVEKDNGISYSKIVALQFDDKGNSIVLYPNPVNEKLHIAFISDSAYSTSYHVSDVKGRLIQREFVDIRKGDNDIIIDMRSLAPGNYLLHLDNDFSSKIIKE